MAPGKAPACKSAIIGLREYHMRPDKQRSRFSLPRILTFGGIASLLLIYPLLWLRVLSDPRQRTAADFLPFYAAGRVAVTRGFTRAYDLEAERQAEDDVLNTTIQQAYLARGQVPPQDLGPALTMAEVNPFPHPPFILPLLFGLAHLGYVPAFVIWSLLMIGLFILGCLMLVRLIPEAQAPDRWILLLGSVLFFPAFFSFINGQDSAILFLGAVLWFSGLFRGRDRLSGLGLALTTIRPQVALALALPFIFKRRRVGGWFCIGAGFLVFLSLVLLGKTGTENYLHILTLSASGSGFKFINDAFHIDLGGLLHRDLPWLGSPVIRAVGWTGFFAALLFLCWTWAKNVGRLEKWAGLAVIMAVFFAPHFNYHDLVLLLIPLYGSMRILLDKRLMRIESVVLLPLGLSFTLFVTYFFLPFMKYFILYPIMGLLLVVLWFPEKVTFWHKKNAEELSR